MDCLEALGQTLPSRGLDRQREAHAKAMSGPPGARSDHRLGQDRGQLGLEAALVRCGLYAQLAVGLVGMFAGHHVAHGSCVSDGYVGWSDVVRG